MTPRERYLAAMSFGPRPDRVPLEPGGGRESTRKRWLADGLPPEVKNPAEFAYRQAGGTLPWPTGGEGFPVDERMIPWFEEKVLSRGERSQIVQDWKGNICEISNDYTFEYLRVARDFVTRRWLKCPVSNRLDWAAIKTRYQARAAERLPADAAERGRRLRDRQHLLKLNFSGPFWQLREWVGFEGLCMMFLDQPDFVRDMVAFWENHVAILLERLLEQVVPDEICISEDMAYKAKPMIGPAMARDFLLPCWRRWAKLMSDAGVPIRMVDSDGYIGDLIPLWVEAGFNACSPMEIAANNDLLDFRRRFGPTMAYHGGVDKRLIAKGGPELAAALEALRPLLAGGGFVPGCDHAVPHDVSWPHFVAYVGHLARVTGWL